MNHLSDAQIEGFIHGSYESAEEYEAIAAHLTQCLSCRARQSRPATLRPSDRIWVDSLAHPDDDMILHYIRDADSGVGQKVARHLASCQRCQDDVAFLRRFHAALTPDSWDRAATVLKGTPVSSSPRQVWDLFQASLNRAILERITAALATASTTLRLPRHAYGFRTDDALYRQPLRFDDPDALGSFIVREDGYQIHIEHRDWPEGTLVLLQLLNDQEIVLFQRFCVLKEDFLPSADLYILSQEAELVEAALPRLLKIRTGHLTAEFAEPLRVSYEDAAQNDPDAVDAWRIWAERAQAEAEDEAIQAVAERIRASLSDS